MSSSTRTSKISTRSRQGTSLTSRLRKYFKSKKLDFDELDLSREEQNAFFENNSRDSILGSFVEKASTFVVNQEQYHESDIPSFIKKVLIYLTMVIDNVKNFVKIKTRGDLVYRTTIDPLVSKHNEAVMKKKISDKAVNIQFKFKIDRRLLGKSVEELTESFRIKDLILFLKISQINFPILTSRKIPNGMRERSIVLQKNQSPDSDPNPETVFPSMNTANTLINLDNLNPLSLDLGQGNFPFDGKKHSSAHVEARGCPARPTPGPGEGAAAGWVKFSVHEYEIDEIVLAKRKRTDEKLKHSFRAVCLGIKQNLKANLAHDSPEKANAAEINLQLTKRVFGRKKKFEWVFENKKKQNITKNLIDEIKRCKNFVREMDKYVYREFLKDEIQNNILNKKEKIMNSDLCCKSFLTLLMTKTKKNGWILQNSMNSLDEFLNCKRETILKVKQRKRRQK